MFRESKRITISAMTRYGKTFCAAIAIAIIIETSKDLGIAFIGPGQEQAGILRQYMADLILKDKALLKKTMLEVKGSEKIQREVTRKRMTFTNGCEYRVFSAEGEAKRLMGFGADIVVKDESCLISRTANTKIMRMLGDNPEDAMLIELYNPWDRDNVTFENTLQPHFHKIHVGWKQAVREGRTTIGFVEEQRKIMTPLEFTVLYESRFPDESEDSLFSLKKIEIAEKNVFNFEKELQEIETVLENAHKLTEKIVGDAKREMKKYKRIIACDPADKGLDETVIFWGTQKENRFQLIGHYSEAKSESMQIAGKILDKAKTFIGKRVPGLVNIDRIGIGTGPLSRLKETLKSFRNIKLKGCHYGEAAMKKDHYMNKKAENFFRLKAIFDEGLIDISKIPKLKQQLLLMKWELTSSAKKKIIDPEDKSPDWADTLNYFTWKDGSGLAFSFG